MLRNKIMVMLLLVISVGICFACGNVNEREDYLRIHIRANSNSIDDQNVKYKVKDSIVEYLTPYIAECNSYEDVVAMVNKYSFDMEEVANKVLKEEGFEYLAKVSLNNEYFPTRTYQDLSLEANFYDAIIVSLGAGVGDNWWCVVYPPLCFKDTKNIVYKSKILEIINNLF